MKDSLPNLYDHWIAQDVFAYLRLAGGSLSRDDFLRVMNRPKRHIGRECLEEEIISWEVLQSWYEDKPWVCERIQKLRSDLKLLGRLSPSGALHYIRHIIGYEDYLKEYAAYRGRNEEELLTVFGELEELAKGFSSVTAWKEHIAQVKEELLRQAKERDAQEEAVSLSTMHSSKGLEYRIVFIIDANEGITPHKRAVSTRKLYGKKAERSRFVEEFLEED